MPAVAVLYHFCELVVDKFGALVGAADLSLFVAPMDEGELDFGRCVYFRLEWVGKPRVRASCDTHRAVQLSPLLAF